MYDDISRREVFRGIVRNGALAGLFGLCALLFVRKSKAAPCGVKTHCTKCGEYTRCVYLEPKEAGR